MLNVIKRDCSVVEFDSRKIEKAILKAMKNGSGRVDAELANDIALNLEYRYQHNGLDEISIYDIEKDVFIGLCKNGHNDTARAYEGYRAVREFQRLENTTDESVVGLISGSNSHSLNENANKRGELISTQAQLIYEEVSKDIALRKIYPPNIAEAHRNGIIHQHDLGHALTKNPNCCLINLDDMLQNGTVINGRMVEKPNSFQTACTIATQIIAQIASNQHGGCTVSLQHLSPFVVISRDKIRKQVEEEFSGVYGFNESNGWSSKRETRINQVVESRLKKEIEAGIQTFNYQINTLQTSAGQSPFVSLVLNLNEKPDLVNESAILIHEVVKQRLQGIKNEVGVYTSYEFPKLLYVLDKNNTYEDSEYFWLTEEVAKCTAKRLVPDFLSAKKLRENYEGQIVPPMGKLLPI
ncbi:MAG: anaerobic ribonucleoside-triphosphate reductase [Sarcina sp.]